MKLTQNDLSQMTGITQADFSRFENGTLNPSLNIIKRIALGLGLELKLEFIDKTENSIVHNCLKPLIMIRLKHEVR